MALEDRLRVALERLIERPVAPSDRFGVAVSGGPDSMALLHLLTGVFPGQVEAATVDHALRPESAAEALMVKRWCEDAAVPHATLTPAVPIAGSLHARAREARYALLEDWRAAQGLDWLLTAHHADDQLETLLMRLNRGSGVAGLAGVRGRSGRLLRPLLDVRKAELEGHAVSHGLPVVIDPSNADQRFDRARLRERLEVVDWLDPLAAARSASALADADAALAWSVERLHAENVRIEKDALVLQRTDLPREYLLRLLARMIAEVSPGTPPPRGESVDEALVQLCRGKQLSLGGCIVRGGACWTVRKAPPRRTG